MMPLPQWFEAFPLQKANCWLQKGSSLLWRQFCLLLKRRRREIALVLLGGLIALWAAWHCLRMIWIPLLTLSLAWASMQALDRCLGRLAGWGIGKTPKAFRWTIHRVQVRPCLAFWQHDGWSEIVVRDWVWLNPHSFGHEDSYILRIEKLTLRLELMSIWSALKKTGAIKVHLLLVEGLHFKTEKNEASLLNLWEALDLPDDDVNVSAIVLKAQHYGGLSNSQDHGRRTVLLRDAAALGSASEAASHASKAGPGQRAAEQPRPGRTRRIFGRAWQAIKSVVRRGDEATRRQRQVHMAPGTKEPAEEQTKGPGPLRRLRTWASSLRSMEGTSDTGAGRVALRPLPAVATQATRQAAKYWRSEWGNARKMRVFYRRLGMPQQTCQCLAGIRKFICGASNGASDRSGRPRRLISNEETGQMSPRRFISKGSGTSSSPRSPSRDRNIPSSGLGPFPDSSEPGPRFAAHSGNSQDFNNNRNNIFHSNNNNNANNSDDRRRNSGNSQASDNRLMEELLGHACHGCHFDMMPSNSEEIEEDEEDYDSDEEDDEDEDDPAGGATAARAPGRYKEYPIGDPRRRPRWGVPFRFDIEQLVMLRVRLDIMDLVTISAHRTLKEDVLDTKMEVENLVISRNRLEAGDERRRGGLDGVHGVYLGELVWVLIAEALSMVAYRNPSRLMKNAFLAAGYALKDTALRFGANALEMALNMDPLERVAGLLVSEEKEGCRLSVQLMAGRRVTWRGRPANVKAKLELLAPMDEAEGSTSRSIRNKVVDRCESGLRIWTTNPRWDEHFELGPIDSMSYTLRVVLYHHKDAVSMDFSTSKGRASTSMTGLPSESSSKGAFLGEVRLPLDTLRIQDEVINETGDIVGWFPLINHRASVTAGTSGDSPTFAHSSIGAEIKLRLKLTGDIDFLTRPLGSATPSPKGLGGSISSGSGLGLGQAVPAG